MKVNAKILSDKITPEMLLPKTPGSAGIDLMAVNFPVSAVIDRLLCGIKSKAATLFLLNNMKNS